MVTFVDDQGNTLKTETVKKDHAATPPPDLEREDMLFDGWRGNYRQVNEVITVKPGWKSYPSKYGLWVGNTPVNEDNKDDILNDGGKAKFDPATNTLTLNDSTIEGE